MKYTPQEVIQFIQEEDVKFIRLAFCDCFGRPKNISIMPHELERAFKYGIAIDASAIAGFGDEVNSDLFLHPDASTIALLPWRPEHGSVVRMFCSITHPDGTPFAHDTRGILKQAVADAAKRATPSPSDPSWNSTCSGWTKTARSRTFLTIRPPIWMSRRRTDVKMSAGRSA